MCDINTTPLIDVMLVLLIMFIITIPIMTHAVKLDMPQAEQSAAAGRCAPRSSTSRWTSTARWFGTEPWCRALKRWRATSGRSPRKDPQPEMHLRPDRRAKYDYVARVLAAAQRNRMKKIGFVNTSEFRD